LCRVTLTRGFWFADLESGDGFGGRAAGLGQQLVAVVDAEAMVGGLDGQGSSSVDDSDVNALPLDQAGEALSGVFVDDRNHPLVIREDAIDKLAPLLPRLHETTG